jgi:hypothetical protein
VCQQKPQTQLETKAENPLISALLAFIFFYVIRTFRLFRLFLANFRWKRYTVLVATDEAQNIMSETAWNKIK